MQVNKVNKFAELDRFEVVKFQILMHCYFNKIQLSTSSLDMLTWLAIWGKSELRIFCTSIRELNIFSNAQSVANNINERESELLIIKTGKSKKQIEISKDLKIVTQGNILVEVKTLYREPTQS